MVVRKMTTGNLLLHGAYKDKKIAQDHHTCENNKSDDMYYPREGDFWRLEGGFSGQDVIEPFSPEEVMARRKDEHFFISTHFEYYIPQSRKAIKKLELLFHVKYSAEREEFICKTIARDMCLRDDITINIEDLTECKAQALFFLRNTSPAWCPLTLSLVHQGTSKVDSNRCPSCLRPWREHDAQCMLSTQEMGDGEDTSEVG